MDQIFEIAFRYYTKFYSYKGKFSKLWLWLFLSTIFGIGFLVSIIFSFQDMSRPLLNSWALLWEIKWVLLFEVLFLGSHEILKNKRNQLLTTDCAAHRMELRLVRAKRRWIKQVCDKSEFEYSDFIREIRHLKEAHKISAQHNINWREIIASSLYNSDAKPRITSYFIFCLSLISLLTIKDSEGLSDLMPTILDQSYQGLMTFIMVLSIALFVLFIGALQLIRFTASAIDTWLSVALSAKKSSYRFVDLFVADLASMHRLPRLRK